MNTLEEAREELQKALNNWYENTKQSITANPVHWENVNKEDHILQFIEFGLDQELGVS